MDAGAYHQIFDAFRESHDDPVLLPPRSLVA